MTQLKSNQSGIAHITLILLIVIAIGLVGLVGYSVYRHNSTPSGLTIDEVKQASGCTEEEPLPDECQDSDSRADADVIDDEGPTSEL